MQNENGDKRQTSASVSLLPLNYWEHPIKKQALQLNEVHCLLLTDL